MKDKEKKPTSKGRRVVKTIFKVLISIICIVVIIALAYLAYIVIDYSRIKDNLAITPQGTATYATANKDDTFTIVTQNLGFGAYTADFTFFMDGGKESWARSRSSVRECINAGGDKALSYSPDFVFFQEVDFDSTRSYHIDESKILKDKFPGYSSTAAVNYHSSFLLYPFNKPHGSSNSEIMTFSRYGITSCIRRSLPISKSFSKFLDLDRCYSISRVPVSNGKELVLFNVHLSAYGGSDTIRKAQMSMLFTDIKKEYDAGNYCVCGGDFNHDFTGTSTKDLNGGDNVDFGWAQPFPADLLPSCISRAITYDGGELKPTCRNCDVPYKDGNFTIIVDGFLVTSNVTPVSVENVQTGFAYSDHSPVKMMFTLN